MNWIKCSERLPPEETVVIALGVVFGYEYDECVRPTEIFRAKCLGKSRTTKDGVTKGVFLPVPSEKSVPIMATHWMPLPEPRE